MKRPSLLSTIRASQTTQPAVASLLKPKTEIAETLATATIAPKASLLAASKAASEARAEAENKSKILFSEEPVDYQLLLDNFDSLMSNSAGIDISNIDMIRSYVKRIMKDLKANPEFDKLFMDRDAHNVIKLIRHLQESGKEVIEAKKVKATKAVANKIAKAGRFGDMSKFDLSFDDSPNSVEDFSKLDF